MSTVKLKLKSTEHLEILTSVKNFLEYSKNRTVESKNGEKVEKIEFESSYTLPFKYSYWLKRNTNKGKHLFKEHEEITNEIIKSAKDKLKIDDEKYSSDKEYTKSINTRLQLVLDKELKKSSKYEDFKNIVEEIDYFQIETTEKELEELDKEHGFLIYIPENLLDTIFKFN